MNITETVYRFIAESEVLSDRRLGLNCLAADTGSCALENSASEPNVRRYTDGTTVKREEFVFAVRGRLSRSARENFEAVSLCERLCFWLEKRVVSGELPLPIFDLVINRKGEVEVSGTADGRYAIRFEVFYLQA